MLYLLVGFDPKRLEELSELDDELNEKADGAALDCCVLLKSPPLLEVAEPRESNTEELLFPVAPKNEDV